MNVLLCKRQYIIFATNDLSIKNKTRGLIGAVVFIVKHPPSLVKVYLCDTDVFKGNVFRFLFKSCLVMFAYFLPRFLTPSWMLHKRRLSWRICSSTFKWVYLQKNWDKVVREFLWYRIKQMMMGSWTNSLHVAHIWNLDLLQVIIEEGSLYY